MGKIVLTPYSIEGKGEQEVRCVVWDRLIRLISRKDVTSNVSSVEETLEIAGKDTLFDIVAGAFLAFAKEDTEAVSRYIESKVHELFIGQEGE